MHHGEFSHDNTEYQFVNNRDERDLLSDDEYNTESCAKDPWWIEAVKVADDIENKQKVWEINNVVSLLEHITSFYKYKQVFCVKVYATTTSSLIQLA